MASLELPIVRSRGWYWKEHGEEYERSKVSDIEQFCGWTFLIDIARECENTKYGVSSKWTDAHPDEAEEYVKSLKRRDQALVATLFLTGGRVVEVLQLRKKHFSFGEKWIWVTGMDVVKRWKKKQRN